MPNPVLDSQKQQLRQSIVHRLFELDDSAARAAGELVATHVSESPEWRFASEVVFFASMTREVDIDPLIVLAEREGKQMLFPRMIPGPSLEFVPVTDSVSLRPGRLGVREPDNSLSARPLGQNALVLVPGLAFDSSGGRLGRGAGYYDRAFAKDRANGGRRKLIGVGFAIQIVECVPVGSTDVPMDRVVTENGFCRCD